MHTVGVVSATMGCAISASVSSRDPITSNEGSSCFDNLDSRDFTLPTWRSAGVLLCDSCCLRICRHSTSSSACSASDAKAWLVASLLLTESPVSLKSPIWCLFAPWPPGDEFGLLVIFFLRPAPKFVMKFVAFDVKIQA